MKRNFAITLLLVVTGAGAQAYATSDSDNSHSRTENDLNTYDRSVPRSSDEDATIVHDNYHGNAPGMVTNPPTNRVPSPRDTSDTSTSDPRTRGDDRMQ